MTRQSSLLLVSRCVGVLLLLTIATAAAADPYALMQEVEQKQRELKEKELLNSGAGANGKDKNNKSPLPPLESMLGQNFFVSVISTRYGTFNATLRLRQSVSFKERLTGELVPHNNAVYPSTTEGAPVRLPHFNRDRTAEDELLPLPAKGEKQNEEELYVLDVTDPKRKKKLNDVIEHLRPSILYLELQLKRSDANEGFLHLYYPPANPTELEEFKAQLEEGSVNPFETIEFQVHRSGGRSTASVLHGTPLMDVEGLQRWSTGVVGGEVPKFSYSVEFFSEFEFTLSLQFFRPSEAVKEEGEGEKKTAPARTLQDTLWLHAYALPYDEVYNRHPNQIPAWMRHSMLAIALVGFALQLYQASQEGKKKKAEKEAMLAASRRKGIQPKTETPAVAEAKKDQ